MNGISERRTCIAAAALVLASLVFVDALWGQATGRIQGQVVDASTRAPLVGAQVSIVGPGLGVLTDNQGRFAIRGVPAGPAEVRAAFIGYRTGRQSATVLAGGETTVDFQLAQSAIALDEVVVTGTPGATARREIGNSVAQVKASEVVEAAPIADINQLITGRTAGVVVLPQSGNIGSGAPIRLRGSNSLSLSGQPIVYVDGVRVDANPNDAAGIFGHTGGSRLQDFNPEDFESIEIIKGPAAATLYGTEASNGVIQIITKKGRVGETRIGLRIEQGANWLSNAEERIPTNWGRTPDGQLVSQNLIQTEREAGRDIFRTGHSQVYGLSAQGGSGTLGYYLSGEYEDIQGIYENNGVKRFSTRANLEAQINDEFKIGASFGLVTSENPRHPEGFSNDQGIISNILFATPLTRDTDTRGFFRAPPEESNELGFQQDINRFTWGVQATYDPTSWFAQRLNVGLDVADATNTELWPRQPEGADHFFGSRGLGQKEVEEVQVSNATVDYAATATVDLGQDLNSATSFGLQYFTKQTERTYAFGRIFPSPSVTLVGSAANTFSDQTFVENKTLGVFVQERIGWRNRLFLTGAVRADDNSAFGRDFDAVVYPKVSGVWVVSEEPFWRLPLLDDFRLRAAWGMAGQQPDAFAAVRTFAPETGADDGAGFLPANPGNPLLAPEKGAELEAGFDASLFSGRLGMVFTYYTQTTRDAIVLKDVPPSTGFPGSQYVNLGQIDNRGFELELDTRVIERPRLSWDVRATLAKNDNEIVKLGGPAINAGGFNTIWHREGYPLGSFFSKRVVQATETGPGQFADVLCDGGPENDHRPMRCADAPMLYLGPSGPVWQASMSSSVAVFGNLRLHAMADYRGDQRLFDITTFGRDAIFRNSDRANMPEKWDVLRRAEAALGITGQWVERHDFIAFRELSATYSIPEALAARMFAGAGANLRVGMRNLGYLYVHPEFRDLDPDVQRGGSGFIKSQQTLTPQMASFVASLNLSF